MDLAYLNEALDYNPENGSFIWKRRPRHHFDSDRAWWQWNGRYAGTKAGTTCKPNPKFDYIRTKIIINKKMHFAHRLAWRMAFGEIPQGYSIDHIDGDATNNSIINLRLVKHSENHKNRGFPKNNTSGAVGVKKIKNRWRARIKIDQKEISLGSYETFEEAKLARERAAKEYGFTERHIKIGA